MKKFFSLTAALALCALTAWADDFNLYYVGGNGSLAAQKWEVAQLSKVTFEGDKMNVIGTDGSVTEVPIADIRKLVFFTEEGATDIKDVEKDEKETKGEVRDLMGRLVTLDRDQLPKGIYIIDGKKTLIK